MAIPMIPMIPSWFQADSVRKAPKRPSLQLHSWTTFCLWCRFLEGLTALGHMGPPGDLVVKNGYPGYPYCQTSHLRAELYNKSVPKICYLEKIFQSYVWVRVAPMGEASKGDRIELRSDETPKVSKLFQPSSAQISELSPIHPDRRHSDFELLRQFWVLKIIPGIKKDRSVNHKIAIKIAGGTFFNLLGEHWLLIFLMLSRCPLQCWDLIGPTTHDRPASNDGQSSTIRNSNTRRIQLSARVSAPDTLSK